MKQLSLVLILLCALILSVTASHAAWNTEGPLTDPAAGDLLADTGALGAGLSGFTILIDSNAYFFAELAHRNALNTADLHTQPLFIIPYQAVPLAVGFTLGLNERLQLRVRDAVTGTIQGSILK